MPRTGSADLMKRSETNVAACDICHVDELRILPKLSALGENSWHAKEIQFMLLRPALLAHLSCQAHKVSL